MYVIKALFGSLILILFCLHGITNAENTPSLSIGKYNAGCVKNSYELPESGKGYQVIRTSRERNFANSEMVDFLKELARKFHDKFSANILVADISQKGGGPILDDHSSHQTGLDADILFFHNAEHNELYSIKEREKLKPVSTLNSSKNKIDFNKWSHLNGELLKAAANFQEVDRIFVNPAIKKHLCENYPGEEWLKKLRPWWGHDGHFHVRLSCPENNPKCENITTSLDIECGPKLNWWFSKEAHEKLMSRRSEPKTEKDIKLPKECIN